MIPLFAFERRWVLAILDTIFPGPSRGGFLPLGAADLDVDAYFDDIFGHVPLESALGLRAAIWFLALSPLFVVRRFTTFSGLSEEERERVYLELSSSRVYVVRSLVIALKAIGSLLYCANEAVRPRILGTTQDPDATSATLVPLRVLGGRKLETGDAQVEKIEKIEEKQAASA